MTQCQSVALLKVNLNPIQHYAKNLNPQIALYFKVVCESKAMLPLSTVLDFFFRIGHQVPVQLSSKYDNEMPEYSNLPQPRTQATLASAAANAATSMSFNR